MDKSFSNQLNRRDFVKVVTAIVGTVIGTVIGLPVVGYLISPALRKPEAEAWVPLGSVKEIPPGVPKFYSFTRKTTNGWENTVTSYGVFAVRKDEASLRVFSNICTHLGCHVAWHADLQHYVSPCHNGHFDLYGNNISGPPPRPLDEYQTKVEDGKFFVLYPPFRRS